VFDPERAVARRSAFGGTAPDSVREQLALARQAVQLQNQREVKNERNMS
jgi:argininosuccinate lyase